MITPPSIYDEGPAWVEPEQPREYFHLVCTDGSEDYYETCDDADVLQLSKEMDDCIAKGIGYTITICLGA